MKPASFKYYAPRSVDEAAALLGDLAADDGRILAGGQSLLPSMAFRMAKPAHLIDINRIATLANIDLEKDIVRIGACVRHAAFESPERVPGPTGVLLGKVVRNLAHPPIRARGTFCGSLANADPSSEWLCAAAALDATIIARSRDGERRISSVDFFQGVMTTDLRDTEMIAAVELPLLPADTRSGFVEFSRRRGDFAIGMVLAAFRIEGDRAVDVRIAVGGVEATPRRISEAEAVLTGSAADEETFIAVAETLADVVDPTQDDQHPVEYRRSLIRTLAYRALKSAT
ncbi:MAG: FAD binding domain-containing protein [Pseudolabrys sp.]|nr:FAD binding domain-containing protein [Pseudolabrys sp.]MDP2295424.1 FAD binding domain-containing protein [Pseudolabrys sp.]